MAVRPRAISDDRSFHKIVTMTYFSVTVSDRCTHTALYGGVRYSERDFMYPETEPGNRPRSIERIIRSISHLTG